MSKSYSFGFVCNPLDNFNREAETSLFLMREIAARGHSLFVCEPKDLFLKQKEVWGVMKNIAMTGLKKRFYKVLREAPLHLKTLDALFIRTDPPFDMAYLNQLLLLRNLEKEILMINSPDALLRYNEKLAALEFPFCPRTLVSARVDLLSDWSRQFKRGAVVKPLNEAGGRGIVWMKKPDKKHLKKMTASETVPIQAQEYLPDAKKGDHRILLWNGKTVGAFARKPRKGEFRANLHLGGTFAKHSLTARDEKITKEIAVWSKREGLLFVGFDMIGRHLTEINITSPMGIREVNEAHGLQIEKEIINDLLRML